MADVMEMSTDPDIRNTQLDQAWGQPNARYSWTQVGPGGLNLPAGVTIVVVAHGNGNEIGNANPGLIDIDAAAFLALIQSNMQDGAFPAAVFISTCGPGIAQFTAAVRLLAEQNQIWQNTHTYGHSDPVSGPVPPPNDIRWTPIF